jgi:hypothetical protein
MVKIVFDVTDEQAEKIRQASRLDLRTTTGFCRSVIVSKAEEALKA